MIGAITAAQKSKSLKTLSVQINGTWYTTKSWELEQALGRRVIFEPSIQSFPDGGSCTWLNDYVFEDVSSGPAAQAMDAAMAAGPTPPAASYEVPYGSPPADVPRGTTTRDPTTYLSMTSNLVAHAIQAGLITKPDELEKWACAAMSAAKSAVEVPY